jgi:hypothetical protein
MSSETAFARIVLAAILPGSQQPSADAIRHHLAHVDSYVPDAGSSGCFLRDICGFLVNTSILLSRMTNDLVHGDRISTYIENKIREVDEISFSDLSAIDDLNQRYTFLMFA